MKSALLFFTGMLLMITLSGCGETEPGPFAPGEIDHYDKTEELYFTILHTNDEHSALIPHSPAIDYLPGAGDPTFGGAARLASAVEEIRREKRAEAEPVLLFSAGDFIGGTAFSWLARQGLAPELEVMQAIGYDAVIIGNHEYDYGPDVLASYLRAAGYPEAHGQTLVLAANTRAPAEHPLAAGQLYRSSGIIELENNLKVGVFGLIGEQAVAVTAETGAVEFLDEFEIARASAEELRERGADIIIAITHSGFGQDRELARRVPGIDVIVGGHTHTVLEEPVLEGETIIVQAGDYFGYLGRLELAYNPGTGNLRIRNRENNRPFLIPIDSRFQCHPEITPIVERYIAELNELIGTMTGGRHDDIMAAVARADFIVTLTPELQEAAAGNFVTDAFRLVIGEATGERVDVAMQANGIIRKSIIPGGTEHARGKISFYDLIDVMGLGFGNDDYPGYPLVSVYLTGDDLRRLLEVAVLVEDFQEIFIQFSGLRYSYNPVNAAYFYIPFVGLPYPTVRAVSGAELYTGEGVQPAEAAEGYVPLNRKDRTVYRLVTDAYMLSFFLEYLPQIENLVPDLYFEFKNGQGDPVCLESIGDVIIYHQDGREFKAWEAMVTYAASQPPGADGIPQIPSYYETTAGRINQVRTFPLVVWPVLIFSTVLLGIILLVRHRRLHKKTRSASSP